MLDIDYAMLFPGQGSQSLGMMARVYSNSEIVRDTFTEASDILEIDLWSLIQSDERQLNLTTNTQPILLASSYALWSEFMQKDPRPPTILAGHSLGEFSALVCAGAIEFADALLLVRQRGQYMQEAVPYGMGSMAAILGLEDENVDLICRKIMEESADDLTVSAVNYNSPGQVVIAGHTILVEEALSFLKAAGAKKTIRLPVSAPFHTSLMLPAGEKLASKIEDIVFRVPKVDVLSNVTAQITRDPSEIKQLLVEQISSPVNWTGCMQYIIKKDIKMGFECGPGKILTGICRRIDRSFACSSLEEPEELELAVKKFA